MRKLKLTRKFDSDCDSISIDRWIDKTERKRDEIKMNEKRRRIRDFVTQNRSNHLHLNTIDVKEHTNKGRRKKRSGIV